MPHWVEASDLDDPTLAEADEAAAAASLILYALSGRKYSGLLTVTERYPCKRMLRDARGGLCGSHQTGIRLRSLARVVHSVAIHSTSPSRRILAPSEYRLVNRRFVKPARGADWHTCSDVEITYTYGSAPPEAGRRAALVLANQLLKARVRPEECQLPDRVTSISRQGVSLTMLDPQDFLQDGRTGLYEVDLFLKSVNPDKARKRARVFSPDFPRPERISIVSSMDENDYNWVIVRGLLSTRTIQWTQNGIPQLITGEWTPSLLVTGRQGETLFDATPYLIIEANGEVGRIDIEIPANVTSSLQLYGEWSLRLTRITDPGVVIELVDGNVMTVQG